MKVWRFIEMRKHKCAHHSFKTYKIGLKVFSSKECYVMTSSVGDVSQKMINDDGASFTANCIPLYNRKHVLNISMYRFLTF